MIKKLKAKFKNWYTKPRYGKLFDFSVWILENPQALTIALIMGVLLSSVVFFGLLVFILLYLKSERMNSLNDGNPWLK